MGENQREKSKVSGKIKGVRKSGTFIHTRVDLLFRSPAGTQGRFLAEDRLLSQRGFFARKPQGERSLRDAEYGFICRRESRYVAAAAIASHGGCHWSRATYF